MNSQPIFWCIAALLLAALLTEAVIRYAQARRMLDLPGQRRAHSVPTPRGGGMAIVVAVLVCAGPLLPPWAGAGLLPALGLAAVALVGWWDDHASLEPLPRILVHLLAGLLLALALPLPALALPWQIALGAVVLLSTVWSINLHNFMDGINGFLSLQAVWIFGAVAGLGALGLAHGLGSLPLLLAAASLGFLPFNFPRARTFLGDAGSGALGFLIAAVLWAAALADARWFAVGLLLGSSFFIDAGATLFYRFVQGRRWYSAHREHLYQWLVRRGWSHARIVSHYMAWNLLLIAPLALFAGLSRGLAPGFAAVALAYAGGLLLRHRARLAILAGARRRA
ncbi:glycosyl transferase family 4 [Tahibacter harae]|uniref:Glycosyl transferase family 4 n=1 Tax=Tahibacter harae TaxID=2963937 RepID=A0ABT1QVX5_9GAMM|nr:glycosyl transferase family 4 [Tahibacter harae]